MLSLKTRFLVGGLMLAFTFPAPLRAATAAMEGDPHVAPATEPIALLRGAFEIAWYAPTDQPVRGLFVLGSGSGGWSYWETRMARHLAKRGWAVAGVDFARYASSEFTQKIVASDCARLVAELACRHGQPESVTWPVIYGGWSMGAEQALPAAAVAAVRPAGLRGLLLVAPGARGRYGLTTADKLGFEATGAGSFALADFAPHLHGLRLAQLHAGLDPIDSIDWFDGLSLDVRLWNYPRAFHDFDNASDAFLALTDQAIDWLLSAPLVSRKTQ